MKVKTWLNYSDEIEVSVTVDDIAASIHDDADSPRAALILINTCAQVLNGIPKDIIDGFSVEQKNVIRRFFYDQIGRL